MSIRRTTALALAVSLSAVPVVTAAAPADPPPGVSGTAVAPPPDALPAAPVVPVTTGHRPPVPGGVLVPADIPAQNWLPGHRGVDLDSAPGSPVRASATGTVRFTGVVAGTPTVSIDHGGGLRTTYEPVLAQVRTGDRVARGEVIGVLADASALPATARRDAGLHWGAVVRDTYIDPMTLLGPVQVRLWR